VDEVVVVGAGLVGLAVARRTLQALPGVHVTVLDKEHRVAAHQSGHNSGVVHAGLSYPPGSLKATLCRRGSTLLREYCTDRGIPYEQVGKVVVAVDDDEVARLGDLADRARRNQVPGLRWLDASALADLEPHVRGRSALHSPSTAITDFVAVAESFAADVREGGGEVRLGAEVVALRREPAGVRVVSTAGDLRADHVVLCAGLQADRVAAMAGDTAAPAIVPFRGEYLDLVPRRRHLVNGLVYPVPDPAYPFLGVHVTRRVGGGVDIGPNAVLALAREGYRRRDVVARDVRDALAWPGFRALARRHWRAGLAEAAGSASARVLVRRAQRYLPELSVADLVPASAGVRAQAVDSDGTLVDDFRIHRLGALTAVRNAPSPAATSSLAIAEHVVASFTNAGHVP
jgi:L-2-hydroxyglutarate oxidase LhgO